MKETCAGREAGGKKREKECEKESGKGTGGGLQKGREWRGEKEVKGRKSTEERDLCQ